MSTEALTAHAMREYAAGFATSVSGNLIDGDWVPSNSGSQWDVFDPSTGERIGATPVSDAADVDRAVRSAVAAQKNWAKLTPSERSAQLYRLADVLESHLEELITLESVDVGKPVSFVRDVEMPDIVAAVRFFTGAARVLSAPAGQDYLPGVTSIMRREPVGVVACITPWNYPLLQAVAKIVPALATGNTCVVKPAETTPYSTARFAELVAEVLPPGVLNVVFGTGAVTGDALARHQDVDMVSFTGSVDTGRKVGMIAADGVKKSVMELGGNSPVVVFADADLPAALDSIVEAGLYNTGQDCMAASRLIVHSSIKDDVVAGLVERVSAVTVGDALDGATTMGPLSSALQRDRVAAKLSGLGAHAKVVAGGVVDSDQPGYFLAPTVVTDVRQDDEIVATEIFGPVFTIQTFDTEDEALTLANGTPYGLASSVFTSSLGVSTRMQNSLDFGTVWVNTHLVFGPDLPVSGFGVSGTGVENGELGILEFTRLKHIMVQPLN